MEWLAAASQVLGAAAGNPGAPAGPSTALSDNVFDSSGWSVATGKSSTTGAAALNPYLLPAGIIAVSMILIVWMTRK